MNSYKFFMIAFLLILMCPLSVQSQREFDVRIEIISAQITRQMTDYQKMKIAVVPFSNLQDSVTDIGRFISEELTTRLLRTGKFRVIERKLIHKVIEEHKLQLEGFIDPDTATELGKLLAVDAIVSGTITDLGQRLRINARLIETETGEGFASAATDIFKDESVLQLLDRFAVSPAPEPEPVLQPQPEAEILHRVEISDFTFDIEDCKHEVTQVTCYLKVINNDSEDRYLHLLKRLTYSRPPLSFIVDDFGNKFEIKEIHLGTQSTRGHRSVSQLLVSGVPTRAKVISSSISSRAEKITLLEIVGRQDRYYGGGEFRIQFRNIELSR